MIPLLLVTLDLIPTLPQSIQRKTPMPAVRQHLLHHRRLAYRKVCQPLWQLLVAVVLQLLQLPRRLRNLSTQLIILCNLHSLPTTPHLRLPTHHRPCQPPQRPLSHLQMALPMMPFLLRPYTQAAQRTMLETIYRVNTHTVNPHNPSTRLTFPMHHKPVAAMSLVLRRTFTGRMLHTRCDEIRHGDG